MWQCCKNTVLCAHKVQYFCFCRVRIHLAEAEAGSACRVDPSLPLGLTGPPAQPDRGPRLTQSIRRPGQAVEDQCAVISGDVGESWGPGGKHRHTARQLRAWLQRNSANGWSVRSRSRKDAGMSFAGQLTAGAGLGFGLQQRRTHSRIAVDRPGRPAASRHCRLHVAAIAAPPRPPLSIPPVVPRQAFIDEVRSPPPLCRPCLARVLHAVQ